MAAFGTGYSDWHGESAPQPRYLGKPTSWACKEKGTEEIRIKCEVGEGVRRRGQRAGGLCCHEINALVRQCAQLEFFSFLGRAGVMLRISGLRISDVTRREFAFFHAAACETDIIRYKHN